MFISKTGLSKTGLSKTGLSKTGLSKTGLAAALLLATASSAFAGTTSYTFYTKSGGTPTTTPPADTLSIPFSQIVALPTFDGSLGTLTSVAITLSSNVTVIAQVSNTTTTTSGTYTRSTAVLPYSLSGAGVSIATSATATTGTVPAVTVAPGANLNTATTTTPFSGSQTLTSGLAPFIGTGSTTVALTFRIRRRAGQRVGHARRAEVRW